MLRYALATVLIGMGVLGGCAAGSPRAQGGEEVTWRESSGWSGGGDAGRGHAAVFANPDVSAVLPAAEDLPEYGRRDVALGMGSSGPLLATSQWPAEPRPDLSDLRVVYIPTYTSTSYQPVTYFGPGWYARWRRY